MQQILLLCLRNIMDPGQGSSIISTRRVFHRIKSEIIDPTTIIDLKNEVAITICLVEKEFPPTLFDVRHTS